jgi:hypothetical protein
VEGSAQTERPLVGAGAGHRSILHILVASVAGLFLLGAGPAFAQGPAPEHPPVKAPAKLSPEPAPSAAVAPASGSRSSSRSAPAPPPAQVTAQPRSDSSSTSTPAVSRARPVSLSRSRPTATRAHAKPRAAKTAKAPSRPSVRSATRVALGVVPTSQRTWNRLLFVGGLALLLLVAGDAAFLALSARALRDPEQR